MHVFAWVSSMELVFFSWTWVFMSHLLDIFVNWIFIRHFGYLTVYGIQHVGFSIVRLYLHRGLQLPVNIEMLWSVTLRSAFYTRQRMTANTIETHSNTIENLKLIWRLPLNRYELNVKIFNSIYFINIYGFTSALNGSPWKLCCFGLSVVISINFPVLRGMVPLLVSWGEETLLSGEALSTLWVLYSNSTTPLHEWCYTCPENTRFCGG